MNNYRKIVVLAGGFSSEREISLKSGQAVFRALKDAKKNVEFIDLDRDYRSTIRALDADVVFIALHGKLGEDGTIQELLEERNIPYTGSDVLASRTALDKTASKKIFLLNNLKVPAYKIFKKGEEITGSFLEFETPFVVKPVHEGSSIGLSIVTEKLHAEKALNIALEYGESVIVEEYIHGRELTVGILGGEPLPVVEISTRHNVYDYKAKYIDEGTKYIVPARLTKGQQKKVQSSAILAHKALGCRDFSRVDLRMDSSNEVYVLEVNTIPGMTERSLLPKAAKKAGINFENLCIKLLELAYERKGKQNVEKNQEEAKEYSKKK
ncbi:MAG: D-alanine--D-alanine ligase [Candidatus Omnitrophota bacterium]